jgi:hypothetical protein
MATSRQWQNLASDPGSSSSSLQHFTLPWVTSPCPLFLVLIVSVFHVSTSTTLETLKLQMFLLLILNEYFLIYTSYVCVENSWV